MRPPPAGGGYTHAGIHTHMRVCASMRPPPAGGGYDVNFRILVPVFPGFNEAAARGRRIPAIPLMFCTNAPASMRPPPAGGGYEHLDFKTPEAQRASMRPPPAGGGYFVNSLVLQ